MAGDLICSRKNEAGSDYSLPASFLSDMFQNGKMLFFITFMGMVEALLLDLEILGHNYGMIDP